MRTRGKAGFTSFTGPLGELVDEQIGPDTTIRYGLKAGVNFFRLGTWTDGGPRFYPGVQFPHTWYALEQLAAQTVPQFELFEPAQSQAMGDNLAALVEKIGPAILITHSQGGLFGWLARIKSENVKDIVSYEPGAFVFPEGEQVPAAHIPVPLAYFRKLTQIPIQIVYGDFIPEAPTGFPPLDFLITQMANAKRFAEAINRHGGDAQVLELPKVGLHGNTHFHSPT